MSYSLNEIPIGTIVEKRIEYENNPEHNFYAKFKKLSDVKFLILDHSFKPHVGRDFIGSTHSKSFTDPSWKIVDISKPSRPIKWI